MEEKKYVTEWANENLGLTLKIMNMVHEEQTPFQHIQIADTLEYGRLLILDGVFQTSVKDEWTYHEMISHVPLMLHPHPERVLIIGGGDGGVAREVCRHDCVNQVDLCDIDGRVIELSKEYFPTISTVLRNPPEKLHVHVGDGIAFARSVKDYYDVSSSTVLIPSDREKASSPEISTKAPMQPFGRTASSCSRPNPPLCSRKQCMTYSKP